MARSETPKVEYSYKCDTCPVHKRYGAARLTAEREAVKHSMRYPDHNVHLIKSEIQHTFKREGTAYHQLGDEAPF
jgi:hypothetical protein